MKVYGIAFVLLDKMEDSFYETYDSVEKRGKRLKEAYFNEEYQDYYIDIYDSEVL